MLHRHILYERRRRAHGKSMRSTEAACGAKLLDEPARVDAVLLSLSEHLVEDQRQLAGDIRGKLRVLVVALPACDDRRVFRDSPTCDSTLHL